MEEWHKREYNRRLRERLCTDCGNPLPESWYYVQCKKCKEKEKIEYEKNMKDPKWHENRMEKNRIQMKRKYYDNKENGLCVKCGKIIPLEGFSLCPICLEKKSYYERKELTVEQRNKYNQRERDLREYRIEHKLCTGCGKPIYDDKFKTCIECRIKQKNKAKRKREKNKMYFYESGTCIRCGNSRKEGSMLCEDHYNQATQQCLKNVRTRLENKMKEGNL